MTSETSAQALPVAEVEGDAALRCYRHPDRETWISCGRCDRPICTSCAMQGPVGARCRDCGLPAHDPLTSFTPAQLVIAGAIAVAGGFVAGLVGTQGGALIGLIAGFFIGTFIAELAGRAVGYKRGPVMLALTFGGIGAGAVLGFLYAALPMLGLAGQVAVTLAMMLPTLLTGAVVVAAAAIAGAWSRMR